MKKQILNIGKTLSKVAQKQINGGGNCGMYSTCPGLGDPCAPDNGGVVIDCMMGEELVCVDNGNGCSYYQLA